MKSIYRRQLAIMISVIALSFSMLGGAFMMLSYRYIITEKREAMERIASGQAQLIIGTHALISEGVQYSDLALVVTTQQQTAIKIAFCQLKPCHSIRPQSCLVSRPA